MSTVFTNGGKGYTHSSRATECSRDGGGTVVLYAHPVHYAYIPDVDIDFTSILLTGNCRKICRRMCMPGYLVAKHLDELRFSTMLLVVRERLMQLLALL